MSHSKFFSSLLLLIILNAIIKPFWIFGIDRQVQNVTGVTEYGTYFSLLNLSIVFGFLLDWGINNFMNRELAAKRTELQEELGSFVLLKFLFFVLYAVVVISVGKISGVRRWDILLGVILIQFLTFLFLFLRNVVTANQWFKTDAWLSVLDKMLMIVACGAFIFLPAIFGVISIQRFIIAQIACTTLATAIVVFILLSKGIVFKNLSLKFFDRKIIRSVLPFAITIFLMSIHIRLDGFLLERLHPNGAHEAGIYAGAYRLLDASNMVGYLVASFLMPFVARLWAEQKPLQEIILQTRHVQLMFAITAATFTVMLAPWLQEILYHRVDPYGAKILQWCLPALIGYGLTQVYGTIMTATGNIVPFSWLNLAAVIINLALNFILIPNHGAFGCCIAALCSQGFLGIATMCYVHHWQKTNIDYRSIFFYVLTGAMIGLALSLLTQSHLSMVWALPITGAIAVLVMWFGRLISLNSWLNFVKKQ